MSTIDINGTQKSDVADSQAMDRSDIEPTRLLLPVDATMAENFSNAVNRRNPLPVDENLCEDHFFGLLAHLRWPDRKTNPIDGDHASDAPQTIANFTPQLPAAADPGAAQPAGLGGGTAELRMQEFHHLICQMNAQIGIDSHRSEIAISLSHAMFSSTRLKVRGNEDSIEVDYECGSAEEADWFGSNAAALAQRLSTTLQRRVTVRSVGAPIEV